VKKVKKIYEYLGVEKQVNNLMILYFNEIKTSLSSIHAPEKDILLKLAGDLINRVN
jgi:hypothetical protein